MDYFIESILKPLIESNLTLAIDLGSSGQPHGQNTHIEYDTAGLPTGRIIHADVEAFWPAPELAKPLGREEFYKQYGYEYHENQFSVLRTTFFTYFVQGVLDQLFEVMGKRYPDNKQELLDKSHEVLVDGLKRRKDKLELIETFSQQAREGKSRVDDFFEVLNVGILPWTLQRAYRHFKDQESDGWY